MGSLEEVAPPADELVPTLSAEELAIVRNPSASLPPPLKTIRRSFELLSICYFMAVFGPALGIRDFSVRKLESDLDGTQPDSYVPMIAPKLLVALTGDRSTNNTNWETRLRREYIRREPAGNPLGDEPVKLKVKAPKRAVGYVYITETVPTQSPSSGHYFPPDPPSIPPSPQPLPSFAPDSLTFGKVQRHEQGGLDQWSSPDIASGSGFARPPDDHCQGDADKASSSMIMSQAQVALPSTKPSVTPAGTEFPVLAASTTPLSFEHHTLTESQNPPQGLPENGMELKPDSTSLEQAPVTTPWSSLGPLTKLRALYKLCEWHFSTPYDLERFRRLIDSKTVCTASSGGGAGGSRYDLSDPFSWRQERCGMDSNGHQYWLAGHGIESRMWVQRKEPQPARKTIKLRIPVRRKRGQGRHQQKGLKRRRIVPSSADPPAAEALTASPLLPCTDLGRTTSCSRTRSRGFAKAERSRPVGTRSSSRLKSHREAPDKKPQRPPTMIVIRKTPAINSQSARSFGYSLRGTRNLPRQRRTVEEVWQDVPPGWLDEVVAPPRDCSESISATSKTIQSSEKPASPLSSELSDPSDEEVPPVVGDSLPDPPSALMALDPPTENSFSETNDGAIMPEAVIGPIQPEDLSGRTAIIPLVAEVRGGDELEQSRMDVEEIQLSGGDASITAFAQATSSMDTSSLPTIAHSGCFTAGDGVEQPTDQFATPALAGEIYPSSGILSSNNAAKTPEAPIITAPTGGSVGPGFLNGVQDSGQTESKLEVAVDPSFPELKGHPLDPDWIEWEVVCSNLQEWQRFCLQFKGTQDLQELALVGFVETQLLPNLVATFQAEEARVEMEKALALRKRSNRIATRETLQASASEAATCERETRMHSERLQAKRLKEMKAEEQKQEKEREKEKEEDQRLIRLKEREERIALREAQLAHERDVERKNAEKARLELESKLLRRAVKVAQAGVESRVNANEPVEHWELNCEICGATGVDVDDGSEVICCDKCEKWQHLACHDQADLILQKPKRDWSTADFVCASCSGTDIPRSLKQLRTHFTGKLKFSPKHSKSARSPDGAPIKCIESNTVRPRITILMSNPNKTGGTSLSKVPPNSLSAVHCPAAPMTQSEAVSLNERRASVSPHVSPQHLAVSRGPTAMPQSGLNLEMYYDDLDKLCSILRSNVSLHRTLPVTVMHRLRRYLIDQQQRRHASDSAAGGEASKAAKTSSPIGPPPSFPSGSPTISRTGNSTSVHLCPTLASSKVAPTGISNRLPPIGSAVTTAASWYDSVAVDPLKEEAEATKPCADV